MQTCRGKVHIPSIARSIHQLNRRKRRGSCFDHLDDSSAGISKGVDSTICDSRLTGLQVAGVGSEAYTPATRLHGR